MKFGKILKSIGALTITIIMALSAIPVHAAEMTQSQNRQADLNYLYDNLKKLHPNVFANTSESEFLRLKSEIESRLTDATDIEFALDLQALTALVGDSHTTVTLDGSVVKNLHFFPFVTDIYDERHMLTIITNEFADLLGMELTAVNGVPIKEVEQRFAKFISHDNEVKLRRQFSNLDSYAEMYEYIGIIKAGENAVLTLTDKSGVTHTAELKPVAISESKSVVYTDLYDSVKEVPITAYDKNKLYFSKKLNDSTYYIQYNSCREDTNLPMTDFCKQVKSDLDSGNYDVVLVDLRNNGGGSDGVIAPLLELLTLEKDKGTLTVAALIGETTFSSAIINAVEFQEMGCALVGEPTSGSIDHFGSTNGFILPNSGYKVRYSTKFISMSEYFDAASGKGVEPLVPDVEIQQTLDDYLAGKDTAVEKIIADPSILKQADNNTVPLTRGRFIGQIYDSLGSPTTNMKTLPYEDLFGFEWFVKAIHWADENKIASGTGNDMFLASRQITWQEAAVFMVKTLKSLDIEPETLRFEEAPAELMTQEWSNAYVTLAWNWGLLPNESDFSKSPTRSDGIEMIKYFKTIA